MTEHDDTASNAAFEEASTPGSRRPARGAATAAFLLGFALSGFFDGVLLHQILQWHHLLSALEGDLRWQVAADGWFHAAMYLVAVGGLWSLWRARPALRLEGAGRRLAAWGLIGFGAWHVADAVGSHWLLAIHRIRMDAENPLAWDLGWLAIFGLVPLGLGVWLRFRPGPQGGATAGRAAAVSLAMLTVLAGLAATRPAPGPGHTVIAFGPWIDEVDALRAAVGADRRLVASRDGVVVVSNVEAFDVPSLYRQGAIFVGGGLTPMGCFAWRRG